MDLIQTIVTSEEILSPKVPHRTGRTKSNSKLYSVNPRSLNHTIEHLPGTHRYQSLSNSKANLLKEDKYQIG